MWKNVSCWEDLVCYNAHVNLSLQKKQKREREKMIKRKELYRTSTMSHAFLNVEQVNRM